MQEGGADDPDHDKELFALRYSVRQRRQVRGSPQPLFRRPKTQVPAASCLPVAATSPLTPPCRALDPQVEFFDPVSYDGELGSQQPMDSVPHPSRKRREREEGKRRERGRSDESGEEVGALARPACPAHACRPASINAMCCCRCLGPAQQPDQPLLAAALVPVPQEQQERRQYSFRDRALVTIKPASQQPPSQGGGGGLYRQGSGRIAAGGGHHERKRSRLERRHGGGHSRLHRTNSRGRLR